MLNVITSIQQLSFRQLLQVYEESIKMDGKATYPYLDTNRQILEAEQDFYHFLTDFLRTPGAFYAVWTSDDRYRAALRIEPYRDGVLLSGLETAPESRKQGFASRLISGVLLHLKQTGVDKVYSHISNANTASVLAHQKCGFQKISDCASFIDGTVGHNAGTYLCELQACVCKE